MKENADLLLRLPGTADEKNWLREHLETLSVREWDILAAAVERSPPAAMADAVNHLLTLDKYEVCPAGNYEALGEFYLREQCVPQEQEPFFDKAALGQWYEDQHPGLFIGRHYVAYPKQEIIRPYDGAHLPADVEQMDWSVRLKLASAQVPDGVWVKLPDYGEMNDEVVSVDAFADHIAQELGGQAWAKEGDAVKGCFDYASYATALAKQQGYCLTGDGQYYIRSRDSPALEQQQTGMTM